MSETVKKTTKESKPKTKKAVKKTPAFNADDVKLDAELARKAAQDSDDTYQDIKSKVSEPEEVLKDVTLEEPVVEKDWNNIPDKERGKVNPGDLVDKGTPPDVIEVKRESLTPKSNAHNAASRHVVTATDVNEGVNKPKLYNPKGVPTTVKSVVDSNRTGLFRIHRDRGINN